MRNLPRVLYNLVMSMKRLYWSKEALRKHQGKHLRNVIENAYESVPFYHEKFRKAGVFPSDIRTVADLDKLPITRKDELRNENPTRLLSCKYAEAKLRTLTTSGSTGKPLKVYITNSEDCWRKAIYLRANVTCGQKPSDRWAVIIAPRHFGSTTDIQRRLGIFAQTCISVFSKIDQQVAFVNQVKPDVLDGYSGTLYLLARKIHELGLSPPRPKLIFGSADLTDAPTREYIEKVFNAPYYDQFGCIEVDRTAWQCPEKVGYHMDVDSVITEFVDEDGCNVSAGETGEILHTSLFNYAMPFIRYSVGDMGRPSNEICPCGRTLPLMEIVEGRKDSFIVLPNGQLASPRMFTVALSMSNQFANIEQFRIIQKKTDLLEFVIKRRSNEIEDAVLKKELVADLRKLLRIDKDVRFDVRFVEDMPMNKSGKLMAVVSEVKPARTLHLV